MELHRAAELFQSERFGARESLCQRQAGDEQCVGLAARQTRAAVQVRQGSDEKFWLSLQDFLEKYKYQEAGTQDFIDVESARIDMVIRSDPVERRAGSLGRVG